MRRGGARDELDIQRRSAEDPVDPQARYARQSLGQMPGERRTRLPQGSGSEPLGGAGLRLSHAHARRGAAEERLRRRPVRDAADARRAARSAEVPRRQALHGPPQGEPRQDRRAGRGAPDDRQARRHDRRRRAAGFRISRRLARHGRGRGDHRRHDRRDRTQGALHHFHCVGRRAHAGRHVLADADAAHDDRRAANCARRSCPTSSC